MSLKKGFQKTSTFKLSHYTFDRKHILYSLLIIAIPALAILQYRWIGQLTEREYDHARHVLELSGAQIVDGYTQHIQSIRSTLEGRDIRERFPGPSRPMDIRNIIPDNMLSVLHESARDYLANHIRNSSLAGILDSSVILSYFDERFAFHLERFDTVTHRFIPVEDSAGRFNAAAASARITPTTILVHVIDTSLSDDLSSADERSSVNDQEPWLLRSTNDRSSAGSERTSYERPGAISYFLSTSLKPSYFTHLMDSLVHRAIRTTEEDDGSTTMVDASAEDTNPYSVAVGLTAADATTRVANRSSADDRPSVDLPDAGLYHPLHLTSRPKLIYESVRPHRGQRDTNEQSSATAHSTTTDAATTVADGSSDWTQPDVLIPLLPFNIGPRMTDRRRSITQSDRQSPRMSAHPRVTDHRTVTQPATPTWSLLMKSTTGSLFSTVRDYRIRNLLISFGILLTLGASIVLLVIGNNRAARLAEQQVRFLAGISHELRTPIAVIRSASENISDGLVTDPARVRTYGSMIKRETDNLWQMVERVLQYSSIAAQQTPIRQLVDLSDIARSALQHCAPIAQSAGVRIECQFASTPLLVDADAAMIGSCIENLLVNAIKYGQPKSDHSSLNIRASVQNTHEGIHPSSQITDYSASPIRLQTRLGNPSNPNERSQTAVVVVTDSGNGIAYDEQQSIFEPFFRGSNAQASHERGNGLGLSLVRNAVEMHGGNVSFISTPSDDRSSADDRSSVDDSSNQAHDKSNEYITGSSFTISLPLSEADRSATVVAASTATNRDSKTPFMNNPTTNV